MLISSDRYDPNLVRYLSKDFRYVHALQKFMFKMDGIVQVADF